MLSTPEKRFLWARPERFADFSFFRTMLTRRSERPRRMSKNAKLDDKRWKPAPWTPWLWVK